MVAPVSLTLTIEVVISLSMETGNIVLYIDSRKIICAVIMDLIKNKALLLDESNREVSLSFNRILHAGPEIRDISLSRDQLTTHLQQTAVQQNQLAAGIDIPVLWELLFPEPEWVDVPAITRLCFSDQATWMHEAAVIRALFENRLYFKFDRTRFFPYSPEQVARMKIRADESRRHEAFIEKAAQWLGRVLRGEKTGEDEDIAPVMEILKSSFLFEKESPHYATCRDILTRSGIQEVRDIFTILVQLNVFSENENIDLLRMAIPIDFSPEILSHAAEIKPYKGCEDRRRDLSDLSLMTIDGPGTRDFDDALSIQREGDHFLLGIHIMDVANYIKKNDLLDKEAFRRGSSIYMPDLRIPMLPIHLAEHLCSLKADEMRPAISLLVKITPLADILSYEIIPSTIRIKHQLTYADADFLSETHGDMSVLNGIARNFRIKRLSQGATHISLPEIHFKPGNAGDIDLVRIDRESPGRLLVAELMILANWLFARHLGAHKMPAIFRSQPEPKERLYRGVNGTLFQNYMQRRLLNRFVLWDKPERHAGLGLDAYVTATSPIRKYYDLVAQRQIRATLGMDTPYTREEINAVIQNLEIPLGNVGRVQAGRNRFWILRHLEKKTGERIEAMVLSKRRNGYQILLHEYMMECHLPVPGSIKLKPEDFIHVKIQHVDPGKEVISVFLG